MTLAALLEGLYARLRYPRQPATAVTRRLTAFVNETQLELLALPGMERLRDDVLPITALANQARMGLPPIVGRIHAITDRTNNRKLEEVPLRTLRLEDPGQVATGGPPIRFAVLGYQHVALQPSTTGLWAVSSDAADTTPLVYAEGLTTGGYRHITAAAGTLLTGTTRVRLGTRSDVITVEKFYLDIPAVGAVSLYDAASSGTELARLAPGSIASRYLTVEWYPVPTADTPETLDYSRNLIDLTNDTDEALLPADFGYVLDLGVRKREYEFTDDATRAAIASGEYERGKAALRSYVLDDGDRIASLRRTPIRWSRLGGNYPPNG